jgi:hypothetical protein
MATGGSGDAVATAGVRITHGGSFSDACEVSCRVRAGGWPRRVSDFTPRTLSRP